MLVLEAWPPAQDLGIQLSQKIFQAPDYRAFLRAALCGEFDEIPRGRLAELSYRAGFSSRSFLTEVLQGKKRLTPTSLPKISAALRLKGNLKKYFELLVAREEAEVREQIELRERKLLPAAVLRFKIEQLRVRLEQLAPAQQFPDVAGLPAPSSSLSMICVYAALGGVNSGATLAEIAHKAGFEAAKVEAFLGALVKAGFASRKSDRYFATGSSFDFQGQGRNISFLSAFEEAIREIYAGARKIAAVEENLVFLTALPVSPLRQRELKERLRGAVLDVLDEFQDDEIGLVKKLAVALY